MPNTIKVHLYHVVPGPNTPSFQTVLQEARTAPFQSRLRTLGMNEIRLESILAPADTANNTPYWFLDMTRLRFAHGPGKASRTAPVQGFNLGANEGFGEETAALYDPRTKYLLVQYNHHGVRASTIKDYFSLFNVGQSRSYEFRVKLDDTSEARLAQKQVLTKISFKVAPASMTASQRSANVGLGKALDLNDALSGQSVEVTVSAGQGKNAMLSSQAAARIINGLRNLAATVSGDDIVEKFEVTGRSTPEERAEVIDMLAPKIEQEIDGIIMGSDRRYTQQSRWDALLRARHGWNHVI